MFSLMGGDGECFTEEDMPERINKALKKNGCAKDFAQIFTVLALAAGLDVRIVSNGVHYASEIYNGKKNGYT